MGTFYVKLAVGQQRNILEKAIAKAGSERKLSRVVEIPASSIYYYKTEKVKLPVNRFEKLIIFLGLVRSSFCFELIDSDSFRKKGGLATLKIHQKNGSLEKILTIARFKASEKMRQWHSKMKSDFPFQYYQIQYERFKKIGGYKYKTLRGELVRNALEKDVADLLFSKNINYVYEGCVMLPQKCVFPDFLFNDVIIECTAWKGIEKAVKLKEKTLVLERLGYKVIVVVPFHLKSLYFSIITNIKTVSELDLYLLPE